MVKVFLLVVIGWLQTPSPEEAYRDGRFLTAYQGFQQSLQAAGKHPSAALLFNYGNAALRLGRTAEAIWAFRRAQLRSPRDPQVALHLRFAEEQLTVDRRPETSFAAEIEAFIAAFRPREWLALVIGLQSLAVCGWLLSRNKPGLRSWMLALGLLSLAGEARWLRDRFFPPLAAAVVLQDGLEYRESPSPEGAVLGRFRAGTALEFSKRQGDWLELHPSVGTGWVSSDGFGWVD
ncbi:MAG: hypothetical protein DWQ01_19395 [Planctomycetota bacterium]|nr:MAG: hypothetical protein DWQ01_19395 [Planctomycetota bacterium]